MVFFFATLLFKSKHTQNLFLEESVGCCADVGSFWISVSHEVQLVYFYYTFLLLSFTRQNSTYTDEIFSDIKNKNKESKPLPSLFRQITEKLQYWVFTFQYIRSTQINPEQHIIGHCQNNCIPSYN